MLVTHFNHPAELTSEALLGLDNLRQAGVLAANQSVLLKGVNDDPEVLVDLCKGLLRTGVRPYYIHHLDPAPGTAHSVFRSRRVSKSITGSLDASRAWLDPGMFSNILEAAVSSMSTARQFGDVMKKGSTNCVHP